MSIKKDLKREGIEVIGKLDTLTINSLAKNISSIISQTFPELNLNTNDLFRNISRLNMYYARLPQGISAKYFYKNKSIYFSNTVDSKNLTAVAMHECIHYLQEVCDNNGNILRLGLCDYTSKHSPDIGINEAAVQLMASKCLNKQYENVKYFGIDIPTNSPSYYTLECALLNQMAYVVGENILFDSTLTSNDKFKEQFISLTSKNTFYTIEKNIDLLVETQEKLASIYASLQEFDTDIYFIKESNKEINKQKSKITKLFLDTQKLILTSYFDSTIKLVYTPKTIENYRNKLYLFKNYIGQVDGDTFYNDYYIDKMVELEKKYESDSTEITDLVVVKHNFISTLFRKIKTLFGFKPGYAKIKND